MRKVPLPDKRIKRPNKKNPSLTMNSKQNKNVRSWIASALFAALACPVVTMLIQLGGRRHFSRSSGGHRVFPLLSTRR